MSIKSFDDAHDFLPATESKTTGLFATLALVWQSLSEGLTAQHRYEAMRAQGASHATATRAVSVVYPGR